MGWSLSPYMQKPVKRQSEVLLQEVLQRLRQRRMSRLSHSQHEIQGILQCSEPSEGDLSESAAELDDPGPAAGPYPELREPADQADIEDMGALAHDIRDADMQEADQQQQLPSGKHSLHLLWAA